MRLRLISYLAPSIPYDFFKLIRQIIAGETGSEVDLRFEERISGPMPGDENPLLDGSADIAFLCAPSYAWMRKELEVLAAPVSVDPRADGKPVYFSDVIVHADSAFASFEDLRGRIWAYNDRNSRSGWLSMVDRIAPASPEDFFSGLLHSGSHRESLALIFGGRADAAACDSNALLLWLRDDAAKNPQVRILESLGPFPIQPVVIRAGVSPGVKETVRQALVKAHRTHGEQLRAFGFLRFTEVPEESR